MSKILDNLIEKVKQAIEMKDPWLKGVRNPRLLCRALGELKKMVGLKRLKKSISLQVYQLIKNLGDRKSRHFMLHTMLYGPPGVGKTQIGKILAKIWYALGYLKGPTKVETGFLSDLLSPESLPKILPFVFLIGGFLTNNASALYKLAKDSLTSTWQGLTTMSLVGIGLLLIWFLFIVYYLVTVVNGEQNSETKLGSRARDDVDDDNLITVVSRVDFIAEYMGQTSVKTMELLERNRGKVIFIDEAYSLYTSDRDAYGKEALTTLNLYMSDHPDSVGIIFAGYKDDIVNTIFAAQPGLKRRCMWQFECDPYQGKDLIAIFYRQVLKAGYMLNEEDLPAIRKLILENVQSFPSYGGDTERLVYFAQLASCQNQLTENLTLNPDEDATGAMTDILTLENIKSGLDELKHNTTDQPKSKVSLTDDMMQRVSQLVSSQN